MGVLDKLLHRDPSAPPKKVTPLVAVEMQRQGAILLDVRERPEWTAGHAPKSRNIAGRLLQQRSRELPSDATILTICRSGNRSSRAAAQLRSAGFTAANVTGGMLAWKAAGLPITANGGKTGHVS